MFDHPSFDAHEEVVFAFDEDSGLKSIIAIHNTHRGPALGGCRVWTYKSADEALTDALRLSRGMTYKAAVADLPLGGGKSVMMLSPGETKTPERFSALGRVIDGLSGQYIVAEDVGSTPADMTFVRRETRHVAGTPVETGGTGDPSPTTSYGVFVGLMRTAEVALGRTSLKGVHVAVQGLGSVGYGLARYLAEAGARLTVSDINPEAVARAEAELGATPADPEAIATVEADIFSPNALGAVLSPATIPRLNVAAVVGAANNQLHADSDGEALRRRGILYAPDYVVNAGGLIQMGGELMGWSRTEVDRRVAAIADRLGRIFARAQAHGVATNKAADALAEERFSSPEVALA